MTDSPITIGRLIDQFLTSLRYHAAPTTHAWYSQYLKTFRLAVGEKRPDDITNTFVYGWLEKHFGHSSASTQHAVARVVVRLFNWAADEGIVDRSPLRGFRKPAPESREAILTLTQYALCVRLTRGSFRDTIKFLWHSGCRPQEVRVIENRWLTGRKIVLPRQQSKGKRKRRIIYLDDMAFGLVQKLSQQYTTGPLFRNANGEAWTKNSLSLAFRRLRDKTGIEGLCAYTLRHSFITRLLEKGVDVATVAAIAGNSPRMILENYNHVAVNESRLLRQLG